MCQIHYELFSVARQLSKSKAHVTSSRVRFAMKVHLGQASTLCSIASIRNVQALGYKILVHHGPYMHSLDCQLHQLEPEILITSDTY